MFNKGNRGNPNVAIISEPGLHRLIDKSNTPKARAFQRCYDYEVKPALLHKGGYAVPGSGKVLLDLNTLDDNALMVMSKLGTELLEMPPQIDLFKRAQYSYSQQKRGGATVMTLWILFCRMTEKWDTLFTFYARDREHAERRAEELLREHPYERLELKEYPRGFRMVMATLPGRIEENAEGTLASKAAETFGKEE